MTPERWQKVKEIFQAALEHAPEDRSAFLASACGRDGSLRREVQSLIASHEKDGSFIDSPAYEAAAQIVGDKVQLESGRTISHYKILEQLGVGGMGEVYLAVDTKLGRKVALKILPAHFSTDADRLRRFQQEAAAASALNHPNIITIYEIGAADDREYIATEFIEGKTLRTVIDDSSLTLTDRLDITTQAAAALEAAHEAGIVHRDIKPDNIMIRGRDGIVKVLDFGLAKLIEKSIDKRITGSELATRRLVRTMTGVVMGTTHYMSPEQARGAPIDERTDIWSLGVVLYEMLSGFTPFGGETAEDVRASILKDEFQTLPQNIPAVLRAIVEKALRKDKDQRYQTISEMLSDLRSARSEVQAFATEPPPLPGKQNLISSQGNKTEKPLATQAMNSPVATSSAEYIVNEIKLHRKAVVAAVSLLIAIVAFAGVFTALYLSRSNKTAADQPIDSIAVLPFINESGNSDVEYLSDGMTESLINSLSRLPHLSVKARSTVFHYKGKEAEPQRIAAELSVQAILSGRVVQRGNDLTLYLSLVDGRNGNQIWGEQYNRKLTDLLALQTEIAHDVSEKLRLRLTNTEQQRLAKRGTENAEAYQAYLKGMYYWNKGPAPGFEKSREYFQQAIDLDPTYALAYSGLAGYYAFASTAGLLPPNENWPKAEAAANKALALDDTPAETYNALAAIKLYYYRDWPSAERYFRRGIELDPNSAEIRAHYSLCLAGFERGEEALAEAQHSVELEPLSPRLNYFWGITLFFMRQDDRAIDQFRKTLELDSNYVIAHESLGDAYEKKGMQREAIAAWAKALTLRGEEQQASILERTYAASGFEAAVRALAKQQLEKLNERMKRGEYVAAAEYVTAYTRLGDKEQAFAWVDKAVQERNGFVFVVKVNPIYDKLRADPRFQESLRKVGF